MRPPLLDSIGRSYEQASQTPGALGGNAGVVRWHTPEHTGVSARQIVRVEASPWRLIEVIARVIVAPTGGALTVDVLAKLPGASSYVSIFTINPTIPTGEHVASGGLINPEMQILPVGTLVTWDTTGFGGLLITLSMQGAPTERAFAWRYASTDFSSRLGTEFGSDRDMQPQAFSSDFWIVLAYGDGAAPHGKGIAVRTEDGGITWDTIPAPDIPNGYTWTHFGIDAGGRLWGLASATISYGANRVYYSDDQGDTWTLSMEETGFGGYNIRITKLVTHPTDVDRITVIGVDLIGDNVNTFVTMNRGSSWVRNESASGVLNYLDAGSSLLQLEDGRLLISGGPSSGYRVVVTTSDDDGLNWTTRLDIGASSTKWGWLAGPTSEGRMYLSVMGVAPRLRASDDSGDTWLDVSDPSATGIAYNLQEDALYKLSRVASGNASAVLRSANEVDWENYSDVLLPIGAHSSYDNTTRANSLTVIPGGGAADGTGLTVELHHRTRAAAQ